MLHFTSSNDIVLHRDVTAVIIIIRGEETRIGASTQIHACLEGPSPMEKRGYVYAMHLQRDKQVTMRGEIN